VIVTPQQVENLAELSLHIEQRLRVRGCGRAGGRHDSFRGCRLRECRSIQLSLQLLLSSGDREAFGIEELLDPENDVDLALRVETLAAAALVRGERGELRFPVAEDIRLNVCQAADFADLVEAILHRSRL